MKQSSLSSKFSGVSIKVINSLLPVLLAFFIGGIIIAAIGENPLSAYGTMIGKQLFTAKGLGNTLHYASHTIRQTHDFAQLAGNQQHRVAFVAEPQ